VNVAGTRLGIFLFVRQGFHAKWILAYVGNVVKR
jgi:hypothetical protein